MNDPFALNLTINLLLLGVGSAMFFKPFCLSNKSKEGKEIYLARTIFLGIIGFVITLWAVLSIVKDK